MIHLDYNTTKTLTFYLQPSLIAPTYLLSLVNYTTRERSNFIAADTSTTSEMLQFSVTEVGTGAVNIANGIIRIVPAGRYTIEVYEQAVSGNFDESLATILGDDELIMHKIQTYNAPPVRNALITSRGDFNNDFNNDFSI